VLKAGCVVKIPPGKFPIGDFAEGFISGGWWSALRGYALMPIGQYFMAANASLCKCIGFAIILAQAETRFSENPKKLIFYREYRRRVPAWRRIKKVWIERTKLEPKWLQRRCIPRRRRASEGRGQPNGHRQGICARPHRADWPARANLVRTSHMKLSFFYLWHIWIWDGCAIQPSHKKVPQNAFLMKIWIFREGVTRK
jgi:hypothetical protein